MWVPFCFLCGYVPLLFERRREACLKVGMPGPDWQDINCALLLQSLLAEMEQLIVLLDQVSGLRKGHQASSGVHLDVRAGVIGCDE
ncbi:hypothetical protein C9F11_45550 (plasmid) [Streptomyces sp. YIM 121038]|nr:hypothetical protein C9F11_45550 [Streptomyces sp. YIM 121038]